MLVMPRPKKKPPAKHILFVVADEQLLAALDAWADEIATERGSKYNRSDLVREQLNRLVRARRAERAQ